MLTPAAMKRVNLFILEKDEARVTRALGRLKAIHLEQVGCLPRSKSTPAGMGSMILTWLSPTRSGFCFSRTMQRRG